MKEILRLALALTLIAAGAGFVLSLAESFTRAPIAEQRRLETLKALKAVLPPADNAPDSDLVVLVAGKDKKGRDIEKTFYRGRQGNDLSGIAFKVVAPDGYSGNIDIMVGIAPDGTISGLEILSHAETPGLGSLITEAEFRQQFHGKNLNNIDWRVKKDGGDFDQLTGATISPRAIVGAVQRGLTFYRENREQITTTAVEVKQ